MTTPSTDNYSQYLSQNTCSWIPTQDDLLQKVTTQSLLHEVSTQHMDSSKKTIPWFLKQMPAAYFRQIPESMRQQHIIAISAIKQLQQSDLSLRIKTEVNGKVEITVMNTEPYAGSLLAQLKTIPVPKQHELSRVKVFSSADNQLALNIYTFKKIAEHDASSVASREDASHIYSLLGDMRNQEAKMSPLFTNDAMASYIAKCSSDYVSECDAHDFLTQRNLYEKVRHSDRSEILIESMPNTNTATITIASSNVRPEVLLRLTTTILTSRKIEINRVHLDTVSDPESSTEHSKGSVTMLRLLISQDEVKKTHTHIELTLVFFYVTLL